MEKKIEHIIANKEYQDLTVEELMLVQDWATDEEAFYLAKQILIASKAIATDQVPDEKIKEDLSAMFRAKYGTQEEKKKTFFMWVYPKEKTFFMRPLVQMAALLFLLLMVYPLMNSNDFESKQPTLANNDPKENAKKNTEQFAEKMTSKQSQTKLSENIIESKAKMAELREPTLKALMDTKDESIQVVEDMVVAPSAERFLHADQLYDNTILPAHRQVVQEKPQILDLLYTSF
jgi:hypothetical protein